MNDPDETSERPAERESAGGDTCYCPRCKRNVEPRERLRWVPSMERVALCQLCPSCDGIIHISA